MQTFGRTDLKTVVDDGGNYQEIEVNWVNPRLLHRKIISDLEDNDFTIKEEEENRNRYSEEILSKDKKIYLELVLSNFFLNSKCLDQHYYI